MTVFAAFILWLALIALLVAGLVSWQTQRRAVRAAELWGSQLLTSQEEEREQLARRLHNDLLQRLCRLSLDLDGAAPAAPERLRGVMADLRLIAHELYPPALRHVGLGDALLELVERDGGRGAVQLTTAIPEATEIALPVALALYRVAAEWLAALRANGSQGRGQVDVSMADGQLVLSLVAEGGGLDALGYGIRQRVGLIGGVVDITGGGRRVVVRVAEPVVPIVRTL